MNLQLDPEEDACHLARGTVVMINVFDWLREEILCQAKSQRISLQRGHLLWVQLPIVFTCRCHPSSCHNSEANGRVVHRKGFAKTYSTNIVEGVGHS